MARPHRASWIGPAGMGRRHATAWACWWSRPPRLSWCGAACGRRRRRCWPSFARRLARRAMKALVRWLALVIVAAAALQVFFLSRIALMATVDPQSTSFERSEAWRIATQKGKLRWRQQWTPYAQISDNLKRAVIASEDGSFANHDGVDWEALEKAWERNAQAEERAARQRPRQPAQAQLPPA